MSEATETNTMVRRTIKIERTFEKVEVWEGVMEFPEDFDSWSSAERGEYLEGIEMEVEARDDDDNVFQTVDSLDGPTVRVKCFEITPLNQENNCSISFHRKTVIAEYSNNL